MTIFEFIKSIDRFFFDYTISSVFLGLFRISVCSLIIIDFLKLKKDIMTHILPDGLFPSEHFLKIKTSGKYAGASLFAINKFYESKTFAYLMIYLFYILSFASLLGLFTNFSLIGLLIIYTSIQNRLPPIWSTCGEPVLRLIILCLALTKCGEKISIDYLIGLSSGASYVYGWPIRMLQIYLCGVYFSAALSKSRDPFWISGKALKYSVLNYRWGKRKEYAHKLFDNKFSVILNHGILLMQFFAPLFLWLKDTRFIYILMLMSFHLGTLLFLEIGSFGPIFIVALFSFFDYLF